MQSSSIDVLQVGFEFQSGRPTTRKRETITDLVPTVRVDVK
jgi:hypothetical protein